MIIDRKIQFRVCVLQLKKQAYLPGTLRGDPQKVNLRVLFLYLCHQAVDLLVLGADLSREKLVMGFQGLPQQQLVADWSRRFLVHPKSVSS